MADIRFRIDLDTRAGEAAFRGLVRMGNEAAKQIQEQLRAAMAGALSAPIPEPDMTGIVRAADDARREIEDILDEPMDPLEVPVEVPDEEIDDARDSLASIFDGIAGRAEQFFFLRDAVSTFADGIGDAFGTAFGPSIALEKQLANVQTLLSSGDKAADVYQGGLLDMVTTTKQPVDDLADGLYEVVSAFGQNADNLDVLETAAQAGAAGLSSTTQALDLLSAVTKGYGDTSADAVQSASDLAFTTVRLGQTNFPELANSIGTVVPLAAALNVTQEELFATMATLTGVTGSASEVSTQYRGILQGLLDPSASLTKLLEAQGVESGKALIQQRGVAGALELITSAAEESGSPLSDYIGSIEGITATLALTGAQSDDYVAKLAEMQTAAGATADAFEIQSNTLASSMESVGEEIDAFRAGVGATHGGLLQLSVDGVGGLIGMLRNAPEPIQQMAFGMDLATRSAIAFGSSGFAPLIAYAPQLVTQFMTAVTWVRGLAASMWAAVAASRALQIATGVGLLLVLGSLAATSAAVAATNDQAAESMGAMGLAADGAAGQVAGLASELARATDEQVGLTVAESQLQAQRIGQRAEELRLKLQELEAQTDQQTPVISKTGVLRFTDTRSEELETQTEQIRSSIQAAEDAQKAADDRVAQAEQEQARRAVRAEEERIRRRKQLTEQQLREAASAEERFADQRADLALESIDGEFTQRMARIEEWARAQEAAARADAQASGASASELDAILADIADVRLAREAEVNASLLEGGRQVSEQLARENLASLDQFAEAEAERIETVEEMNFASVARQRDAQRAAIEEAARLAEQKLQQIQSYIGAAFDGVVNAFETSLFGGGRSDAEIEKQKRRYRQEEAALKDSLKKKRIDQEDYALEMQLLDERRSAFSQQVEAERAGFITGSLLALSDVAKQAALDVLKAELVKAAGKQVSQVMGTVPFPLNIGIAGAAYLAVLGLEKAITGAAGFFDGGYTGGGDPRSAAGVVHGGEFVMTADTVRGNPLPFYSIMDSIRTNRVSVEELAAVARGGYFGGGFVPVPSFGSGAASAQGFDDSRLIESQERIAFEQRQDARRLADRMQPPPVAIGGARGRLIERAAQRDRQQSEITRPSLIVTTRRHR